MSSNPKTQDDSRIEAGTPSYSGAAKFLWEVHKDTPFDELGRLYERWEDDTEQVDLDTYGGDGA